MARGKAATFEQQRGAILDAAAHLFATEGFRGASMAQLARACGVSKALLYHYYRDKEHLLSDIARSHVDRLAAIVASVAAEPLAPEARLRALITAFMAEYEHAQDRHMVLVQDVKFLAPEERAHVVARQRAIVDAFAAAIAAVKPRWTKRVLRVPLAMVLFGMINWSFTWLDAAGPLTYADMADLAADIFLRGVLPPAPAQAPARRVTKKAR